MTTPGSKGRPLPVLAQRRGRLWEPPNHEDAARKGESPNDLRIPRARKRGGIRRCRQKQSGGREGLRERVSAEESVGVVKSRVWT